MLSHAVMSAIQVFPSFVMLSLTYVFVRGGLPSVEMWFNCGEDRYYGLSKVGMMETVESRQVMWVVLLESAKNRILVVDPRTTCATTCQVLKDRRRRPEGGEWEPIKISQWNLAYIPKLIWHPSLLTQPRAHNYSKAIGLQNQVRDRSGNTKQC
jgi:hypothetical protein